MTPRLASSGLHRHTIAAVDFLSVNLYDVARLEVEIVIERYPSPMPDVTRYGLGNPKREFSSPSDMLVPRYDPRTPPP